MSSNGDGSAAVAMAANIQPGGGYGIYERGSDQKSDNLQYNTLGCWVDRLNEQVSDGPSTIFSRNYEKNNTWKIRRLAMSHLSQ